MSIGEMCKAGAQASVFAFVQLVAQDGYERA